MNLFNEKLNIRLSNYRHDRSRPVDKTISELHTFIDTFADQEVLDNWYEWFDIYFGLPRTVVKQYFKKYLADSFDYSDSCGFSQRVLPKTVPIFFYYILVLLSILCYLEILKKLKLLMLI